MTESERNEHQSVPKPVAAIAGAGDLAVTKIKELSKRAADRLSSMESDPSAFADRVQERLETRAEGFGNAFRSAGSSVKGSAQLFSDKAVDVATSVFAQVGETYDQLARRGDALVGQLREEDVKQLVAGVIKPIDGKAKAKVEDDDEAKVEDTAAAEPIDKPATKKSTTRKSTAKKTTAKKSTKPESAG